MATFKFRIPNFAGGDSSCGKWPEYEVHSTEDILNTEEMKYFSENPEHLKFYTRPLTWYTKYNNGLEIMDQYKGHKYGYVRGVVYDLDFEVTLDNFPQEIEQ